MSGTFVDLHRGVPVLTRASSTHSTTQHTAHSTQHTTHHTARTSAHHTVRSTSRCSQRTTHDAHITIHPGVYSLLHLFGVSLSPYPTLYLLIIIDYSSPSSSSLACRLRRLQEVMLTSDSNHAGILVAVDLNIRSRVIPNSINGRTARPDQVPYSARITR